MAIISKPGFIPAYFDSFFIALFPVAYGESTLSFLRDTSKNSRKWKICECRFRFFVSLDLALIEWPGLTLHQFETAQPGKLPFPVPVSISRISDIF